ncbi:MAG: 50S ribosomal protein L10, partial [Firmicutes bacterium]|nr:50S ribosomal protein L10 [Bacillota bacterium]
LEQYKNLDLSQLQGMLIYAFNPEDEVAPAQSIATFAKQKPIVEFVGAITTEGKWLDAEQVKTLADLPNKPVLIGSVIALLQSPIRSIVAATNGNLTNIISGLKAKAA